MHPVLRSHNRIRMNTYQGMKANPVANAGKAHGPANERIAVNAAMIKTTLNGITPGNKEQDNVLTLSGLYGHTFLQHLEAVPEPPPKKGKDHQSCNRSDG